MPLHLTDSAVGNAYFDKLCSMTATDRARALCRRTRADLERPYSRRTASFRRFLRSYAIIEHRFYSWLRFIRRFWLAPSSRKTFPQVRMYDRSTLKPSCHTWGRGTDDAEPVCGAAPRFKQIAAPQCVPIRARSERAQASGGTAPVRILSARSVGLKLRSFATAVCSYS